MASEPLPPTSDISAHTPKASAAKDRSCPYCHQAFTSSSLGRHLDLYIKPKNPKPPDGLHNVEEIRRLRGNITRRQARAGSLKRGREVAAQAQDRMSSAQGSASSADGPALAGAQQAQNATVKQILERSDSSRFTRSPTVMDQVLDKAKVFINKNHNWVATGVINDLPPRLDPLERLRQVNGAGTGYNLQLEAERTRAMEEELDLGRAASMALKEVLGSVWEASDRELGQAVFDFDPLEQNFPGLCLRILSTPSTLFTTSPFSSSGSWSIDPPDARQFEALKKAIESRIEDFKRRHQLLSERHSTAQQPNADVDKDKILSHISDAFNAWSSLPDIRRRELWQLEILRAYARAESARRESESTLDTLRKQVEQLSAELHRAQHRWSSYTLSPPLTGPSTVGAAGGVGSGSGTLASYHAAFAGPKLSADTLKTLQRQGLDLRLWDYDELVGKWRAALREDRRKLAIANGLRSSSPPPLMPQQSPTAVSTGAQQTAGVSSTAARFARVGTTGSDASRSVSATSSMSVGGAQARAVRAGSVEGSQDNMQRDDDVEDAPDVDADGDAEMEDEDVREAGTAAQQDGLAHKSNHYQEQERAG